MARPDADSRHCHKTASAHWNHCLSHCHENASMSGSERWQNSTSVNGQQSDRESCLQSTVVYHNHDGNLRRLFNLACCYNYNYESRRRPPLTLVLTCLMTGLVISTSQGFLARIHQKFQGNGKQGKLAVVIPKDSFVHRDDLQRCRFPLEARCCLSLLLNTSADLQVFNPEFEWMPQRSCCGQERYGGWLAIPRPGTLDISST